MKSRTHYSLMNSSVSTIVYLIKLVLSFAVRSYFIKYLGVEYLGLNGLFTNILSFLSLAELGIGTSIVYELYKPLAFDNKEEIKSLMKLYKRAYDFIGVAVALLGVLLIPLIPFMLKGGTNINHVYIIYILFLSNSVVSYFFTYKRSILNADQQNYKTVVNDFIFYFFMSIIQIVILKYTSNFFLYLIVQIITTLASNLVISLIVNKKYPYLKKSKVIDVPDSVRKSLKKNIIGNISSQIGAIVVLGSDNILISSFVGLVQVGIYGNYTMITNAARSLIQQVTGSVTSSVGNVVAKGNKEKDYNIFKLYLFICSSLAFVCGILVDFFINPFIRIWVGDKFLLPEHTIVLMAIYLVILTYQGASRTFISAYGLFWQQRWKPLFEAFFNILFSLLFLLVFKLGIDGVLLGTIFSSIAIIVWYEPWVVFTDGLKRSVKSYVISTMMFYLKFLIGLFIVHWTSSFFIVKGIWDFIIFVLFGLACTLLLYLLLFGFDKQLKVVIKLIKKDVLNK